MRISNSALSWFRALITVSLLLTHVPVRAHAAPARETRSVSLDTVKLAVSSFLGSPAGRAAPRSLPGGIPVVVNCSALTLLPAWWSATAEGGALVDQDRSLSGPPSGRIVYQGNLKDVNIPIPTVAGHDHRGHVAFSRPGCVNCGVSLFLGYELPVWPEHISAMCFAGYGASGECTTGEFGSSVVYVDVWDYGLDPTDGAVTVVDVDYTLPADQTWAPCECPFGCTTQYQNWVGGPINTRTGNYHYSREDFSIPALGGPLRFERSYNAGATGLYTTTLGYGWAHNYEVGLVFSGTVGGEPDIVIVEGCRGSRFRFQDDWNGDGSYDPFPGVWATLTRTLEASPATYVLRGVDQSTYVFDGTGRLIEIRDPQGQAVTLVYSGAQLARVEDATGERFLAFEYDGEGRLVEVRDPINRAVQYGYSAAGDLTVVTDTRGLAWTYAYTGTHLLYEVRDPAGDVVERTEYDDQGRAVRQWEGTLWEPLQIHYGISGTITITDPLERVTVDGYDTIGALVSQSNADGSSSRTYDNWLNWTSTTDANGHTTGYTFDRMGLPEVITDTLLHVARMAYDDLNHLTAVTDALGHTTRYEYEGNLLTVATDALDGTVANTYDERGLLIQVADHGLTTTYGYDRFGQRMAVTDTLGHVTIYGYDAAGRLIRITNHESRITLYEYDDGDNLIRVTQNYLPGYPQNWQETYNLVTGYGYDAVGNQTHVTDTLGHVTRSWYDDANRLVRATANYSPTIYPDHGPDDDWNVTTQYGYDAVGNQTHVTDTLNHVTRSWYDDLDRLIGVTGNYSSTAGSNYQNQWNVTTRYGYDAVGNQTRLTDTLGHVTRYEYDALNWLVAATDPSSGTTRYGYDALGRQTVVTDPGGVAVYSAYDALGRMSRTQDAGGNATRYGYDTVGNRVVVTDANGIVTRYEYDDLGRMTGVIENWRVGEPASQRVNVRTVYGHDALGNRTAITDANGNATRYVYDTLDRLVAEVDPLGHTTGYGYDMLGNRIVITDAGGGVTRYVYDGLNRLTSIQYPDSGVEYAYDVIGNRTAMTDATGATTYGYDALYRPITVTAPTTGTVGYRYDAVGNRTRVIYPTPSTCSGQGGEAVNYTYDAMNRLEQVEDWDGGVTEYAYDAAGRPLTTTLPNGVATIHGYDGAGRLMEIEHTHGSKLLARYEYTLDGVGNRVVVTEAVMSPISPGVPVTPTGSHVVYLPFVAKNAGGRLPTRVIHYRYDALDRLTGADYSTGETFAYAYDGVGNRLVMTDPTGVHVYAYDEANRLTSVDGVPYTWDDRGNQTGNGAFTYEYDGAGRMVGVEGITVTLAYTYNGDGLRVAQSVDGDATAYVWDLATGLPQVLSDGRTLYVPSVGQWDSDTSQWAYYLADGLGSTRQLADEQGDIIQRYSYTPFGRVLEAEGTRTSALQYTGEHWDGDVGLLYLRARWYDPATGRFLTKDPFPGYAALPQTQHSYIYVGNNPVNLTDPSGEFAFIPLLLVGAAGGALGGLGYYAIRTALNPCVDWNWEEAVFWGGVGTGIGAILGSGIYGGWWIGVQAGWWGPATVTTAGAAASSPAGQRAILWLEQNVNRVQHIMAPKHAWGRVVDLGDDLLENYRRVQPVIRQVVTSAKPEVQVLSGGGRLLTYVSTVGGEQVVVKIYETAEGLREISNAWIITK